MDPDRRLWGAVFIQALCDLNDKDRHLQLSAIEFLSGADGALDVICKVLEMCPEKVKAEYISRGVELGNICRSLIHKK